MERLWTGQVKARLLLRGHGLQQPAVVGRCPFVWRPGLEQDGRAALPLKVQQRRVPHGPVSWGPGLAFQGQSQRHVAQCMFLSPDVRPHAQIEDEVQQFVLRCIVRDGAKDLPKEGTPHAVSAFRRYILPFLPVGFITVQSSLQGGPARQTPDVRCPLNRLTQVRVEVEIWPEGTFDPGSLDELERQLTWLPPGSPAGAPAGTCRASRQRSCTPTYPRPAEICEPCEPASACFRKATRRSSRRRTACSS